MRLFTLVACGAALAGVPAVRAQEVLDAVAADYVKLVLAIGEHAEDYVDAYYGPAEWRQAAETAGPRPLEELAAEADRLLAATKEAAGAGNLPEPPFRRSFLAGQLAAARAYLGLLQGQTLSFDAEAEALYGVKPPRTDLKAFERIQARIEDLLPGHGPVVERYLAFRSRFTVAPERIEPVTEAAIAEARRRTRAQVELPDDESFTLALVTDKPWGAYNWYQGGARSLIEVNVSLPVFLSQIIHYAAHEGYPGHHVYNVLQEVHLARGQDRVEHTILPLFSPVALIAEGSAEAGAGVVFPTEARLQFEREVLFPLAGLPGEEAGRYAEVRELVKELSAARVQLAREYLERRMTAAEVVQWLVDYGLVQPEEARRSISFFDTYRSYIVNYSLGEDIVNAWLDARAGDDPEARWTALIDLLRSARLPADLWREIRQ